MTDIEPADNYSLDQQPEDTEPREPSPRERMMAQIAENAERQRQEEIAQGVVYDEEAKAAGLTFSEEESEHTAPHRQRPDADVAPSTGTQQPDAPAAVEQQLHRIMFDGRAIEVNDQQLSELAQMGMLANVALNQFVQQPPPPQQQYQQPTQQRGWADPDVVKETVRRIQYGGEEEGAEALSRLIGDVASRMPQAPTVDQQAIVQQAVLQTQRQQQFRSDTEIVQREYAELFKDPQLTLLANINVNAIRQRNMALGRSQDELSLYREAGDAVLTALRLPRPNRENQPAFQSASRQEVIERKRAAPRATQTVDRRAPTAAPQRAPSGSEIVEQMRRSRGQASMM